MQVHTLANVLLLYRPYRMNQYLSTESRISENQHHLIHQSNLLRVGGGATTVMSGEGALRLLAINALAQAYEQQYETGKEDEDDEEIDNSCAGNSEANDNRKPAAKESSEESANGKEAADDSSESTGDRKQQANENNQWMMQTKVSRSKCAVVL